MRLSKIHLRGWRSYSYDEGVLLENLKHINVIIGPNNTGKSNLFRYLYQLREMNSIKQAAKDSSIRGANFYNRYNLLDETFSEKDTWAEENSDIVFDAFIDSSSIKVSGKDSFHNRSKEVHLRATHKSNDNQTCLSVFYDDKNYLLEPFNKKPKVFDPKRNQYVETKDGIGFANDSVEYWNAFMESLVFVDPIRHYNRQAADQKEFDFDGSDLINRIIDLQQNNVKEWVIYKKNIQNWVKSILLEELFEIEAAGSDLRFYLKRGSNPDPIAANLSQLGTGVSQLIMLLSYLHLYRDKELNVFIEEPEGNLHPEAVIQLVGIMKDNFKNHRFFFTTHSSVLIDQIDSDWSVHRVMRKHNQSSDIQPCDTIVQHYEVLDELGIRASQLLQSNLVIWIEGPSDRTYINKWIQDHSTDDMRLVEGKHYSFLMYGGSNLANLDILSDGENINIFRTSRYAVIVCDSDKANEDSELKERVKNIKKKVSELTVKIDGHDRSLSDFVYVWVTKGREIENYIPHELFLKVLMNEDHKKHRVKSGEEMKKLIFNLKGLGDEEFGQYDSFDKFFSKIYSFEDGGSLGEIELGKVSDSLSNSKSSIAKSVVGMWKDINWYEHLDLKKNIAEVMEKIKLANGIKY
ncbi:ATP-dependent nuclease [Tumebacillus flagellatus]|uniref:Endonuclease GajA/Old nuclease/RecF-like AAA domain-containing protein n=1 Tax=Tumebacillus flagellatus TaxID=1157490 RepID=A0A074LW53_9BACL|nr:ATP-binding protein [Tumebacillus flagellatus]KEO84278.1 hypothetical protein EL26_05795 [Tumebacillus flagellatus]